MSAASALCKAETRLVVGQSTRHPCSMTPPEVVNAGPVVLRRWQAAWAPALLAAVRASLPQLQAYMAWASDDYSIDSARKFLDEAARSWEEGTEFSYAMRAPDGQVVGASSLMTRMGPGVLEIGYWVHSAFTGRGLATAATVALTQVALSMEDVQAAVIRHDAANLSSGRVAERAGYLERERRPSILDQARDRTDVEVIWERLRNDRN